MPVWVLLIIHIICAGALVFMLWYYASGHLRRLLDEMNRNELYLKRPTKFVHRLIANGEAYELTLEMEDLCGDVIDYIEGRGSLDDFFEMELLIKDMKKEAAVWVAFIKAMDEEHYYYRFLDKYPLYAEFIDWSYDNMKKLFGGCIQQYGKF